MTDSDIYSDVIRTYFDKGFAPIPIPFQSKAPVIDGWTQLRLTSENCQTYFNGTPLNIGILTGEPSGGLVDVDLDSAEAVRFGPRFLPATACVFGHASKRKSHWLYRTPDVKSIRTFTSTGMIVEVRGNGHCTIFPGSVHPSGEFIEFESPNDFLPARSTWRDLERAATKIAIASVLSRHWTATHRHQLALAMAATLARRAWSVEEVRSLAMAIAIEANDEELQDRLTAVDTTFTAYASGRPVSGDETLDDLLGQEHAECVRRWSGAPSRPSSGVNSEHSSRLDLSTDSDAADAFAGRYEDRLAYCDGQWFERRNAVFEPISAEVIQGIAKEFFQAQTERRCLARGRINAAIELSRSQFHVEPSNIDADTHVIGCQNGTVIDLLTGHSVLDTSGIVTKKLGAKIDDTPSCPAWTKFLNHIFEGEVQLIEFVRRAIGYTLTGSVQEQCMFILIGTGANGKSTFLKTLHHLFGDYAATIPMAALMDQRGGSTQTNDLAYLVGKRFVAASEGERGQRLAESKVKIMTGGDRIACRALYKDYFEFDPQFKLWLATNNLPTIIGMDDAIWRRIMVIPFPVTIRPDEQDRELPVRLIGELPGILHWAMDGLTEWRQQGLNPPHRVLQTTGNYRQDSDTVGQWIEAACVVYPEGTTTMKELYDSYKSWSDSSGTDSMSNSCFGKELTRRGFEKIKGRSGNGRRGIGLKPTSADFRNAA
jgi:putative DNA primase/helicase